MRSGKRTEAVPLRGLLVLAVLLLLPLRASAAAPVSILVGEVAGYGDYSLQTGFYETFRDMLEERLLTADGLRLVMKRPTAAEAAELSRIHMDAIARGHRYRREMAGAALIRYADAACGRQDEEKAEAWRKRQKEPYRLGPAAAEKARSLAARYGVDYLIFCNLGGVDVERVRSIFNADVRDFEMRAKEIHAELSYYLVHGPTGRVYEGYDAMDKRGQIIGIVVGQYGKGFTVEQLLAAVLERQTLKASEGIRKDGLPRLQEAVPEAMDETRQAPGKKDLFAIAPFTSRVRITNLSDEEVSSYAAAEDYLLEALSERGLSFVDIFEDTRAARNRETQIGGGRKADAKPRWILEGTLTDLGVATSKRPGSTALVVKTSLSLRVRDADTGEQVFVATGSGESAAKKYEVGLFGVHLLKLGDQEFTEECLYEAMQKAVEEIAEKIAERYGE